MIECDICGYSCKNNKSLLSHQKTCVKYQNVIFVCSKCYFNTKGIKNIQIHIAECLPKNILPEQIINENFIKNNTEIKLKNKDITIMNLQLRLQYEKMKNKIYFNIIQTQTEIKVEDIIKETENEVNIYNFNKGNIPIIVHDFIKDSENYIIKNKQELIEEDIAYNRPDSIEALGNHKFRKVKEYIKTSEKELDTKLKEDSVRVEKELGVIVYNNFDVSHKEIIDKIEEIFLHIKSGRLYKQNLSAMKDLRKKLLGKINLEEYTCLILSHIKRLEEIFLNKKYNKKKNIMIINTSLTPLDTRLVYYEGYTNVIMDLDDVQKFGLVLGVLMDHQKQFVPFDKKIFFNNIKNYSLSLFELQECIERCIINRYNYHNIIYLDRNQKKGDPYSFYSLDNSKDKSKRLWKMECRLEDFTLDFIDNVRPYCINLFRKIYKDVFTDNIYRPDYTTKSQITEFDCEQLIQNIILLSKPNQLCKTFQQIIIKNCTFTSTETDKFNFYGDDKLQQKRMATAIDTPEDTSNVFKQLFDELKTDESLELLNSK